jgi:hypothetical protein
MELGQFKKHIESFPKETRFEFGISEPFSWRGVYAEVAFQMLEQPMTREEILTNIELAYSETFEGWKGGEYRYNDRTNINFEESQRSWTDGGYVSDWISRIENTEKYQTQEDRLVKIAFK